MRFKAISPITTRGHNRYLLELRELSRKLRNQPTVSEQTLWLNYLHKRPLGYKFLRQKPLNRFILDFYCAKLLLDIEVDGDSHLNQYNRDLGRDLILGSIGIKTVRISNDSISHDFKRVIDNLDRIIDNRSHEL